MPQTNCRAVQQRRRYQKIRAENRARLRELKAEAPAPAAPKVEAKA